MTTLAIKQRPAKSVWTRPLASRSAWAALFLVAAIALTIGSVHHRPPDAAGRAAYLDSIIKCPSCDDLSIAQSDAGVAVALRREVREFVDRGWSNGRVEQFVVAQYGSNELLAPSSDLAWLIPLVVGALAVFAVAAALVRARLRRRKQPGAEDEEVVEAAMRHLRETR